MKKFEIPVCNYCGNLSLLVTGDVIYPHRADLREKYFYQCEPCDAYVGCHQKTQIPLGRLADAELRKYKSMSHSAFDKYWKNGALTRSEAYKLLAKKMMIEPEKCHIGMFTVQQCKQVLAICLGNNLL